MINAHIHDNGDLSLECSGTPAEIIASLSVISGEILKETLRECPDESFKETLIKIHFEQVLRAIKG